MKPRTVVGQNGDYEIHTNIYGEGPAILCVHGWPEHAHSWRHQVDYFSARGYAVSTIDVRGYSASSKPSEIFAEKE